MRIHTSDNVIYLRAFNATHSQQQMHTERKKVEDNEDDNNMNIHLAKVYVTVSK